MLIIIYSTIWICYCALHWIIMLTKNNSNRSRFTISVMLCGQDAEYAPKINKVVEATQYFNYDMSKKLEASGWV